jgi:hypothetical protein
MDKGRDVRFVFCDVSKAFDTVWHKGLLFKLKLTGVSEQLISWIESYLSDRQQKVVSEGFSSTLKGINAGVPQGSVLGPFLFLVYINAIVNDINNDIRLFADDTSLFVVVENDHTAAATSLTEDLNVISNWAKKWAVQFNPQKTKIIVFNSRRDREHPPVYFGLNGDEIDEIDINHCHLGITFQSSATWKKHIDDIYKKSMLSFIFT